MPTVYYGKWGEPGFTLEQSKDLIAVRTRSGRSLGRNAGPVAMPGSEELGDGALIASYPEAGVEVYRVPVGRGIRSVETRKAALRKLPDVRFAGGVLVDTTSRDHVLYTENLFVKFVDEADPDECLAAIRDAGLSVKNEVKYATNAWFVEAVEGTGQEVFALAERLLKRDEVEYCHPELIRPRARKAIAPQQWHLDRTTIGSVTVDAHANVRSAHEVSLGEGVTIAVIDDGVDIDHAEFASSGKIVAPRDATLGTDDPRPRDQFGTGPENGDNHGTACAGVACADGVAGASGVAPRSRLMPIRLMSGLGSVREAEAFQWAADHGADVISCSWGPPDARWWDLEDPRRAQSFALPPSTRLAMDYAIENGRGGKGCVILFAAGNGNESIENDGYASYEKVIAVAACNDRGTRSVYSDTGPSVWCAFPSNDLGHAPFGHPAPLTSGIWTTDRSGDDGYNTGTNGAGDASGDYANDFGGTSSATPGAAGVAALVLSVHPELRWHEVREILGRACDRIDPSNGNYNDRGHSDLYGHGRLNARTAVDLAAPGSLCTVSIRHTCEVPLPDLQKTSRSLIVGESEAISDLTIRLEIEHSYVGDLLITVTPPSATGVGPVVLHNRSGGSAHDIQKTYDVVNTPALSALIGTAPKGAWQLEIEDKAFRDAGTLKAIELTLSFGASEVRRLESQKSVRKTAPQSRTPKRTTPRKSARKGGKRKAAKSRRTR